MMRYVLKALFSQSDAGYLKHYPSTLKIWRDTNQGKCVWFESFTYIYISGLSVHYRENKAINIGPRDSDDYKL